MSKDNFMVPVSEIGTGRAARKADLVREGGGVPERMLGPDSDAFLTPVADLDAAVDTALAHDSGSHPRPDSDYGTAHPSTISYDGVDEEPVRWVQEPGGGQHRDPRQARGPGFGEAVLSNQTVAGAANAFGVQEAGARITDEPIALAETPDVSPEIAARFDKPPESTGDVMLDMIATQKQDPEYRLGQTAGELAGSAVTGAAAARYMPGLKGQMLAGGAEEGVKGYGELGGASGAATGALMGAGITGAVGTLADPGGVAEGLGEFAGRRAARAKAGYDRGFDTKSSVMGPDIDSALDSFANWVTGKKPALDEAADELLPESSIARSMFNPETGERFRTRAEFDRHMGLDVPESSAARNAVESSGVDPYAGTQSAPPPVGDSGTVPGRRGARTDLERGLQEADTNVLPRDPATQMDIDESAGGFDSEMADPSIEGWDDAFVLQRQAPPPGEFGEIAIDLGPSKPDLEAGIGTVPQRNRMEAKHAGPWINPKLKLQMEMRGRRQAREAADKARQDAFELDTPPEPPPNNLEAMLSESKPQRPPEQPMPMRRPDAPVEPIDADVYEPQRAFELDTPPEAPPNELESMLEADRLVPRAEPSRLSMPELPGIIGKGAGRVVGRDVAADLRDISQAPVAGAGQFIGDMAPDYSSHTLSGGWAQPTPWDALGTPESTPSLSDPGARTLAITDRFADSGVAAQLRAMGHPLYDRVVAAQQGELPPHEVASISHQLNSVDGLNWSHSNPMRQDPNE